MSTRYDRGGWVTSTYQLLHPPWISTSRTTPSAVLVVSWALTSHTRRIGRAPCQSWPSAASARWTDWWVSSQKTCSQYGSRTTTTIRSFACPPCRCRGGRPFRLAAGVGSAAFLSAFFLATGAGGVGLPLAWCLPLSDGVGMAGRTLAALAFSRSFSFFFKARLTALTSSSLVIPEWPAMPSFLARSARSFLEALWSCSRFIARLLRPQGRRAAAQGLVTVSVPDVQPAGSVA